MIIKGLLQSKGIAVLEDRLIVLFSALHKTGGANVVIFYERAAVDRILRVAFDVDDVSLFVGGDNETTAAGTVRADRRAFADLFVQRKWRAAGGLRRAGQ